MNHVAAVSSLIICLFVSGCGLFGGPQPTCDAVPFCRSGEEPVDECPEEGECIERTECSSTIICLKSGGGNTDAGTDAGDAKTD